jgi:hypothetical protein
LCLDTEETERKFTMANRFYPIMVDEDLVVYCPKCSAQIVSGSVMMVVSVNGKLTGYVPEIIDDGSCCSEMITVPKLFSSMASAETFILMLESDDHGALDVYPIENLVTYLKDICIKFDVDEISLKIAEAEKSLKSEGEVVDIVIPVNGAPAGETQTEDVSRN